MTEIQRKCREKAESDVVASGDNPDPASEVLPASKWYHISDSSVVEISEERVLKSQAYLLLYERVK
jgi:ubiquitin C-terminal hydrolase